MYRARSDEYTMYSPDLPSCWTVAKYTTGCREYMANIRLGNYMSEPVVAIREVGPIWPWLCRPMYTLASFLEVALREEDTYDE
jgi:hypothetical protein